MACTFQEFCRIVDRDLDIGITKAIRQDCRPTLEGFYIERNWISGGMQGGSCYDTGESDGNHYAVETDPEPEFDDLDKILERFCPDITFLAYKKMCKELLHTHTYTQNEYYGNWYSHSTKYVDLKDLYNFLVTYGAL